MPSVEKNVDEILSTVFVVTVVSSIIIPVVSVDIIVVTLVGSSVDELAVSVKVVAEVTRVVAAVEVVAVVVGESDDEEELPKNTLLKYEQKLSGTVQLDPSPGD